MLTKMKGCLIQYICVSDRLAVLAQSSAHIFGITKLLTHDTSVLHAVQVKGTVLHVIYTHTHTF